jgi:lipopolysaccharide transport system ATP-binding protein
MSEIAIQVRNVSKQYRIGQTERYKTLRATIVDTFTSPFRTLTSKNSSRTNSKSTIWALDNLSFDVRQGEVWGIIGRNGAGKSTLLKIISRITEPTRGSIDLYGRVGSLLEVGTGFHPELTGRENIFLNGAILGMKRIEIERQFDEIVAFSELEQFLDTPVKFYSSGMYMRLAFSVAAHLEPEILLIDEVLAVGDAEFQNKCLGKMGEVAHQGRTVLFVSHNMSAIEHLCDSAILLDKGKDLYQGNVRDAITKYLGQTHQEEVTFKDQPVRRAWAKQLRDEIEITAEYELDRPIEMPALGFVISDYLGNPICGSNPIIDTIPPLPVPQRCGRVRVVVKSPKLLNGTYRLSLWFGNGKEDFFHEKDCFSFDIVNMINGKQLIASSVGSVSPVCEWHFEEITQPG